MLNEGLAGIQYPYMNQYDTQTGAPLAGVFFADGYSYVQPVNNQDAASLKLLFNQPSLITEGAAYLLDSSSGPFITYNNLPDGAYANMAGPLIGVIPDADTTNKLINPIDGSVITTDVFGNARTYNGYRDVGAVQQATSVPGPLPLLGLGAAFGWCRRLRRRMEQRSCSPR